MLLLLAFTGPMACLIWVGILVELVVGLLKAGQGLKGAEGPTEHLVDFAVLLLLQFMNGFVGWHEEIKAGDAVDALKKSLAPQANVKREGRWERIPGRELVPGDLVVLALGGAVPADCRLLAGKEIGVDQAALTGESLPVKMREGDIAKMVCKDAPVSTTETPAAPSPAQPRPGLLGPRPAARPHARPKAAPALSAAAQGSTVATGEMEAVVVATGANTFFGKTRPVK